MTAPQPSDPFVDLIEGNAKTAKIVGRYSGLSRIGTGRPGNFAILFEALDERTNERVVLKFLHPQHATGYRGQCFNREVKIGELLVGKDNVVQLKGGLETHIIPLQDPATGATFPFPFRFFALERASGNLSQVLFHPGRPRTLQRRLQLLREVVKGVNRLHNAGFCHRDLKPDNVMMFTGGVAKIGDYGTCRPLDGEDPLVPDYQLPVGDLMYAPPEMFCGGGNDKRLYVGADWFSVGAMLFEAVTSQNLYVAIGLRNSNEVMAALAVERDIIGYSRRVGEIAGHYPIPSTLDFSTQPWLDPISLPTHDAVSGLIRSMCHFDFSRRQREFQRILRALDICTIRAARDIGQHLGGT